MSVLMVRLRVRFSLRARGWVRVEVRLIGLGLSWGKLNGKNYGEIKLRGKV